VQEKLPAVFVEMAALVYAVRPHSRFVLVLDSCFFFRFLVFTSSRTLGWRRPSARAFGAISYLEWITECLFF
jgi:hypothetical protein